MDKLTLDFENNRITIETDSQQGTEYCEDLALKKDEVYKLLGFETVNITPAINAFNALINGKMSKEDFDKFAEKWVE